MLKSIKNSTEQKIITESEIKRDFNSVLNDIPKMNRAINRIEEKYDYARSKYVADEKPLKNKVYQKIRMTNIK